jgi:hypothetical protein
MPKKGTQIAGKVNFSRVGESQQMFEKSIAKGIKGPNEERLSSVKSQLQPEVVHPSLH